MDKTVEQRQEQLKFLSFTGPGPTAYMLPPTVGKINHDKTRKENPAWSMGLKLESQLIVNRGPGPIYMIPDGQTAKGPKPQLYATIKSRTKIPEPVNQVGPGPTAYLPDININRRKAPAYSLAFRHPLPEKGAGSPGPIYLLPTLLGSCIPITIKSRGIDKEKLSQSPGPIYNIGSPNLIKNKGGEVTIKGRWPELKAQSCLAGPGSYNVHAATPSVWRRPPAFSIGVRHSPFAGLLRTETDKCEDAAPSVDDCN